MTETAAGIELFAEPRPVPEVIGNLHHEDKQAWWVHARIAEDAWVVGRHDDEGARFGIIRAGHPHIFAIERASDCASYLASVRPEEGRVPGMPIALRWSLYLGVLLVAVAFFAALAWALPRLGT